MTGHTPRPASNNSPGFRVDRGQLSRAGQACFHVRWMVQRGSRAAGCCPSAALFPGNVVGPGGGSCDALPPEAAAALGGPGQEAQRSSLCVQE